MIYCEVCEMEVEDCACKGGPTAEWPEEDERPVHHVGADVYAPSACGLPMTSVGRTVSQKWPDVTCHRCLETRVSRPVHRIFRNKDPKRDYFACEAKIEGVSTQHWPDVTCEKCLKHKPTWEGPGTTKGTTKESPPPKWWVQVPYLAAFSAETRIATGDGEQPSMIIWIKTSNGDEPQEQTARMICDAVNAWKNRPPEEPTEPWVIEPPVKKQIRCSATTGGCGALIGYTRTMVKRSRGLTAEKPKPGYRAGDLFLRCPVCEARILVEAS